MQSVKNGHMHTFYANAYMNNAYICLCIRLCLPCTIFAQVEANADGLMEYKDTSLTVQQMPTYTPKFYHLLLF